MGSCILLWQSTEISSKRQEFRLLVIHEVQDEEWELVILHLIPNKASWRSTALLSSGGQYQLHTQEQPFELLLDKEEKSN